MTAASPRTRKMGLCIASEGANFATDPSANGSGYTRVPAEQVSSSEETEILETEYLTDRNYPSESEVGAGGSSLTFRTPLYGLATAAGDGTNASTVADDWLDIMLTHAFGTQTTTAGAGISAVGSATTATAGTDVLNVQDAAPIFETGVPSVARSQWSVVTADTAGAYTLEPGFADYGSNPPTTSAVLYGTKRYTDSDVGGNTLAICEVKDTETYTHLGARANSLRITAAHKQRAICEWGFSCDSVSADDTAKTALPAAARLSTTPVKFLLSPVYFNGSRIAVKSLEVDFGLSAAKLEDSQGTNGNSGNELVSIAPVITLDPLHADAFREYKRAGTKGRVLVQLGGGVLSGGVLNTCCIVFDLAEAREVEDQDDAGRMRQRLRFHAVDRIEFSAGVGARFMSLIRA